MRTLLFVCTGNTCRSSMAEAIAKAILKEKGREEELQVLSAGVAAYEGAPASPQAIAALREEAIDLGDHRATQLTPELIEGADVILTMTQSHKDQVLRMVPQAADKVFLLQEFSRDPEEVRRLLERQQELTRALADKQANFFRRHGGVIETLHDEREKLLRRLQEIDRELDRYEGQLLEELTDERQALEELAAEMNALEVVDPYGQPVAVYKECAAQLRAAIGVALEKILTKKASS